LLNEKLTLNFIRENAVEDLPLLFLFFPSHLAKLCSVRGVETSSKF
jgi:hypothetical protein